MSCYPKELVEEKDPDLLKAAKLLRYAKFAVRFQSKSMPDLAEAKKKASSKKKKSVPSYMRKSKATMRREAEIQKKREIIIENSNLAAAEEERRKADKIAALEAELSRLKGEKGYKDDTIMPALEKEKDAVTITASAEKQLLAMPPISPEKEKEKEKEEKTQSALQLNLEKLFDEGGATDKEDLTPEKGERTGDKKSFAYTSNHVMINKLAAKRCFRVLTYRDLPNGKREVMDIPNGDIYYCKTGPQLRRITPYGMAFDSKTGALSERFPVNQVGAAISGNGTTPRILCSFDCWGKTHRRIGGAGAAKYQFCKFLRIVDFLDASKTVSKKNTEHPVRPHYWPKADKRKAPRSPIDRAIYLDKCFNVRPWDAPEDDRPFTPEYKYVHYKPMVPGHKVKAKPRDD